MAVQQIQITQGYDTQLVSAHNQLAIVCLVDYSGVAPEQCLAEIKKGGVNIGTFRLVPFQSELNQITYVLFCSFLKGFMDSFDDIQSPEQVVHEQPHMSANFQIEITCEDKSIITNLQLAHATRQIGESEVLELDKESFYYYTGENQPVYIYFYNDEEGADISINQPFSSNYATDDDGVIFQLEEELILIQ